MYQFPDEIRKLYESMSVPIAFISTEGEEPGPVLVSDGFLKLHGMTREVLENEFGGVITGNLFEKVHPDETAKLRYISDNFAKNNTDYDVIFRVRRPDGYHFIHAVGSMQPMPDGTEMPLIVYADMSAHEETASELADKYQLFRKNDFFVDPLTGLPNINYLHKYGNERVRDLWSQSKNPVILYFDMDSMQSYNNQYGFQKGDELLILFARILKEEFHEGLVVRGADDHFIVIDSYKSDEEITSRIKRTNTKLKNEAFGNTTGIHAGIYVYHKGIMTSEALDHAKRANKLLGADLNNCYRFFTTDDDDQFLNQRYIIENFRNAIDHKWFRIYYQAFRRLETDKIYGFEALARWVDPVRGIISPGEFIPALEKYHMMHELDLYMLKMVCEEVKTRYEVGYPLLPVSVNFSRQDFDYIDVVGEINRIVDEYRIEQFGIDKSYFIIEITEQDMAQASDTFCEQLAAIRESGFKLWIDDFGSGYSSLNVFSRFDVDLIKFDMDLLRNLDEHGGVNREIIRAMIGVSKKFGVHTLCEGVETEEQRQFLLESGCELAQGFMYQKPEPLETMMYRLSVGIPYPECETEEERLLHEKEYVGKDGNASAD